MSSGHRLRASLTGALLVATPFGVFAQGNDVTLSNDADAVLIFSSPSVGGATGANPPDLTGDLFWRALPGDRILAHDVGGGMVEIYGYYELIFDNDWSTEPSFYDRLEGPALPSLTNPGNLEPAFFQLGLTSEVLVSLGPTGLPDPCSLGGICGCAPGYLVIITFDPPGSGIFIPADGGSGSDHATTWLVPGGMVPPQDFAALCDTGDYTFQAVYSTDETQADDVGGISAFSGSQIAGGGPVADPVAFAVHPYPTFAERFLNVLADSGTGLGIERGQNAGGATNGLKLSVGSGAARLSYEVRARQDFGTPNQAFAATSLSPLSLPGASFLGASLLLSPDPLFLATSTLTALAGVPIVEADPDLKFGPDGIADFATPFGAGSPVILNLPPTAAGLDLYSQGLVLRLDTLTAAHTNRVRTSLLP